MTTSTDSLPAPGPSWSNAMADAHNECRVCHAAIWVGDGDPEEGYCLGGDSHEAPESIR